MTSCLAIKAQGKEEDKGGYSELCKFISSKGVAAYLG